MSCFLGDMTEATGSEEKPLTEIPLLSNLSFLHSPFEEKRKGCGRFKCWRLLFLSAILFGQQGCHIINTRPRTWEPLFCTPLPLHEMTTFVHNYHMKNTHPKEAGKWDLIPLFLFFLTWEHPILTILNLQAALLYQLAENRNNSGSENVGHSGVTAHHWHSLSSTFTACQVWLTLHTLYLGRRSPAQQPDCFWSFLQHSKLHSEQKASPFSLALFLTSLHFDFSSQIGMHNDSTTCELLKNTPLQANDIMKTVYCEENVNEEQKVKDF